jgi:ketosteroid isomerase-like protein
MAYTMSLDAQMIRNKMIVRGIYDKYTKEDHHACRSVLHKEFVYTGPKYLPWGGVTRTADRYLSDVVPRLSSILDYSKFAYAGMTAEDNCVIALYSVGLLGSTSEVMFCERWIVEGDKVLSMWSSLFEPLPLLVALEETKEPNARTLPKWSPY